VATGEEHDGPLQTYLKQGDSHKAAAVSFDDVGVDLFVAFLEQQWIRRGTGAAAVADIKSSTDIPTITDADTTTYSSIQPTTVDIKSLPGYWLKDPSDSDSTLRHVVDYRTERYRLDDLLLIKDTVTTGGVRSV